MPQPHPPTDPAAAAPSTGAPRRVLPTLVLAQALGVSPWFAVNAVMPQLQADHGWPVAALATLSSAIQWGFIAGTLVFALLALADRISARRVFLVCALAAAGCTLAAAAFAANFGALVAWRAATGFFLAGIYPVGMKLAALWFPRGLGAALGWLVGALVVGSASAHALRAIGHAAPWQWVFAGVALAAALAGVLCFLLVPEPAHHAPAAGRGLRLGALGRIGTDRRLRASAFGYFGHMVELYTLWVLVPLILATRLGSQAGAELSWWAFAVLAAGALGCIGGGLLASRWGSARVAALQLATSGLCCFAAPWLLGAPLAIFLAWLLVWGVTVAGDSPQFSALTANNAPGDAVGSVLTLVNSIGFAISALSIEFFVRWAETAPLADVLPWLGLGPAVGLWCLRPLLRSATGTPPRQSS